MSSVLALGHRLLGGAVDMTRLIVRELLLGGDPITALLTLGGLSIWAVAFGVSGYMTARAGVALVGELLRPGPGV